MGRKVRKTGTPGLPGPPGEDDEGVPGPVSAGEAEVRRMAARRRLEQYLETRRLNEHLREVFYEPEP